MPYRIHSTAVKCERWYAAKTDAIAAFERGCKRAGIAPPLKSPNRERRLVHEQ